jgi:hypothetical protein
MNVGIGTKAASFLFWGIHKLDFRYSASHPLYQMMLTRICFRLPPPASLCRRTSLTTCSRRRCPPSPLSRPGAAAARRARRTSLTTCSRHHSPRSPPSPHGAAAARRARRTTTRASGSSSSRPTSPRPASSCPPSRRRSRASTPARPARSSSSA